MIPDNKSDDGPLYIWLGSGCGAQPRSQFSIGSTANSRATALCVEIADDSNMVPTGRTCSTGGSAGHAVDRLTGRFVNVPRSHDGESEFTFRLAFVKNVGISPDSLREDALAATGGAVTQVQRVDDRSDLFEITVEPESDEDVTITLSSSGDCGEAGSICTQEEDPRKIYNSPTATVAGPILTASFQGLPPQHDGETAFSFRIAFSDEIATDAAEFRDHSVEVWGGEVTRAEPVGQRRDLWEVEVEPASEDMVMVSLKLTQSCAATGAVCTAGGRLLSVVPATMVPGPATWPVRVTGEARVGKTLTADSSNLSERYGVQVTSMTYRWLADGARVPGANARTYKPDDAKQGKRISVMATYTDDRGNEETVISAPTEPLAARDRIRRATGLPLISGRALVGHTLTADTSLIIDNNGLENAVFHYFWEADDDSIPDATGTTYTPVEADVGKEITFIVAWVDDAGHGQNMTSQPTMPVMTAEAAAAVEFRKSLRVAANADGSVTLYWNAPDEDVTGYRILRHRHSLGELDPLVYVADTGSTATAYTDTGMVAGVPHNYRVQAIRDGVLGERTIQIKIFPVRKATNSPATGAPAISGTAQVGETLTADVSGIADEDGLENVTKDYLWAAIGSSGIIGSKYAYQWLADGADSGSGDHHAGYDYTTYTLAEDDVGKAMSVRMTFVDDAGYQETLTSAATDPVAPLPQPNSPARGAPTIGGAAQVGETLTVDTSGITDEDGLDDSTFTHQWVREDSVMVASAARSYTPTGGDRGKAIKVRVSFTDDAGNRETRTSAQTATVEARANSAGICDRTAQVRDAILDRLPDTSDCTAVTDTELSGIIRLSLSEKSITALKSGDFSGLSNLQHLTLDDNELSALPDGIFDDLSGLQELSLFDNRISRLPDNIFDNLSGLQSLSLSGNGLSELPDGAFDNLSGLQSLGLGDNSLSELPGGAFDNLTELQSLSLGDNSLSELPDGAFDNLTELQWLDLGNNDLSELPGGIFDNLTRLRTLKLSYNDLSELPDGIFDNLTELETLYLHWNRLSELPDGIFDNLTALSSLELSNNELSELSDGLFDDLSELQFLHLSDNELSVLPDGAFDSLTKLWSLSVGGNELSALPEDVFVNLAGLQSLDLNNNELSELADGIFDGLSELHSLHLNGNELNELPDGIFDNLTKLRTLSVDYNGLSELPDSVFDNLSELWGLSLIGNELSELPDGIFDNLANLKQLYLFSNKLSELPDRIFYGLASLDVLNIDENTGSPFTFTVELERPDENTIALKVAQATPFDMEVTLSAEGGSLSSATVTIPAGKVSSEQITVSPNGAEPVAISVVSAAFLLGEFQQTRGIQTGLGEHLTLGEDSDTDTPATGTPTISGTAQVGETLRADTADIADVDGLTGATFRYQWLGSRDTEIQGATNVTYTLVADDEGKTIKVRVTFTDDGGNNETLTSAPTAVVSAALPPPPDNVRAVTQESGAVELTWEAPQDATVTGYGIKRRLAGEDRSDQQRSGGSPRDQHTLVEDTGSADTGYTDESAEKGVEYEYQVSARNEAGAGEASGWVRAGPESASNSPATGAPTISGTAQVGETLTADTSGIADMDGLTNGVYSYRWVRNDGTTDSDITGAMGSTYRLGADDQGKAIKLRVRFSDDAGNWETLTSSATAAVPIEATFTFKIDGTTVTCDSYDVHIVPKEECDDPTSIDQGENTEIEVGIEIDRSVSRQSHKFRFGIYQEDDTLGRPQGHEANDFCLGPGLAESVSIEVAPADGTGPFTYTDEGTIFELCPAGTYVLAVFWDRYNYTDQEYEYAGTFRRYFFINGNDEVDTSIERVKFITALYPDPPVSHDDVQIEATKGSTVLNRELATFSLSIGGLVPDSDPDTTDYVVRLRVIGDDGSNEEVAWCHVGNVGYSYLLKTVPEDGRWAMDAHVLGSCLWHWWPDTLQIELFNGSYEFIAGKEIALGKLPNSPATGAPTINGAAEVGETLTVSTSGIQDANGLSGATFSYQWLGSRDTEIQGATNATYTPVAADEGKAIKVQVSFTDDRGNAESLTSAPTSAVESSTNTPATGAPTIRGTAQVGETLTADITGIADADGLSGETFAYQWVSGDGTTDTDIEKATGATYKLVDADQGRSIKVRVTFTDGGGNEETLTSAPTAPVLGEGPPGAPRNLAATAGNKEVTLSWEPPDDNGNPPVKSYRIQWRIDGKDYDKNHWGTARSTTYTTNDQANLANGVKYFFRVKAGNGSGNSYGPYGPASEEVSATPTSGSAVDLGTPVLSDTENLHHGMVRLDWENVEDAGWYVVQYYHVKGGEWLDLPAVGVDIAFHGSSAVVSNLHGLSWLRVRAMSCAGESEWSQIEQLFGTNASDWEGVPVPEVAKGDQIEPCPVVLGTPVLSEPENLHHGMVRLDWQDIEDAGWYVVQYYHIDGGSGEWVDLPAEGVDIAFHGSSAVVSNLHGLSWLRVGAMSCAGASEWSQIEQLFGTKASDWEGVPVPEVEEGDEIEPCSEDSDTPENSPATGAPTISGTAQVGETLTADTSGIADADGLANATFSYQWLADDADINGATGSTYTLTDSDEGKAVKVEVSFTDDAGNHETLTSEATDAAAAAQTNSPATGAPTISGTAQVGETLTADTSGIADADGLSNVQYEYQWIADDADISGATNATYTLADADEGKAVKVEVSFTDDANNEESLTSAATEAVAAAEPAEPPAKPRNLSATASHDSVTLTWDDPQDDSVTGYVILRRIPGVDPEGQFDELAANTGMAATTYTDDTVASETRYTYRIKAINGAGTSERSRWVHIDTPAAPVPDKPTGLNATATHDSVTLTWDDPGDDSITGYVILRRVRVNETGGDFDVFVADTASAATTYTDNTVAAETRYTYRIKAINEHGTSERSRWYHIDIPAAP